MSKVTVEFNVEFNNDVESLIKLSKLSHINSFSRVDAVTPTLTSCARLNNRTWRLFNHIQNKRGKNTDTLYDLSNNYITSELLSDKSMEKTSLTSTNTSNTLFSHSSNLSLNRQSSSDFSRSSMSNIDEEASDGFLSEDEPKTVQKLSKSNSFNRVKSSDDKKENIFFIANTPSPPSQTVSYHQDQQVPYQGSSYQDQPRASHDTSITASHNQQSTKVASPPRLGALGRQSSLFNNTLAQQHVHRYSSSDISDDDIDEDDESSISEMSESDEVSDSEGFDSDDDSEARETYERDELDRAKKTKESKSLFLDVNAPHDKSRTKSKSDDSEWSSVSSEDGTEEPVLKPINFIKRNPPSRQMSSDTIILSQKKEESPNFKPRSLLSGMFLNELAKQHEEGTSNIRRNQSMIGTFNYGGDQPNQKPVLKRSSTTGIFTVGQGKDNKFDSKVKIKRPSIMFQKTFTSMTDISKNYPHYSNKLVENDIVEGEIANHSTESVDKPVDVKPEEDYSVLTKQKSIVGVSDFNVTSDSLQHPDSYGRSVTNSVSPRSSSILSTSLNKYSITSNNSFKNVISKSSLNLSSFFAHKKYQKNNTSNEKFKKSTTDSIHSCSSTKSSQDLRSSQELRSHDLRSSQELRCQDLRSSQELRQDRSELRQDRPELKHDRSQDFFPIIKPPSPRGKIRSFNETKSDIKPELSFLKQANDTIEEHEEIASPNPQTPGAQDSGSHDSGSDTRGINIRSPKSTRKSMIDSELSKSLKESIIIDYNLGKVPLPKRIINTEATNDLIGLNDDDLDDYYSKGW